MARKNRHWYDAEKVGIGENRRKGDQGESKRASKWQPAGVKLKQRSD